MQCLSYRYLISNTNQTLLKMSILLNYTNSTFVIYLSQITCKNFPHSYVNFNVRNDIFGEFTMI